MILNREINYMHLENHDPYDYLHKIENTELKCKTDKEPLSYTRTKKCDNPESNWSSFHRNYGVEPYWSIMPLCH